MGPGENGPARGRVKLSCSHWQCFMSIQIFLQGKLVGIREFLCSPTAECGGEERVFAGKSWWVSLLSEILPRALLSELGLSNILLGASGGAQFLLVLPQEFESQAEAFL